MSEREHIAALEKDLKTMTARAKLAESFYEAAKLTIKAAVKRAEAAEQKIEQVRQAICNAGGALNRAQRIIAGEE